MLIPCLAGGEASKETRDLRMRTSVREKPDLPAFKILPGKTYFNSRPAVEVYTPGGELQKETGSQRDPIQIDTIVQMVSGSALVRLNSRDRRYRITSPSHGKTPTILVTGKGTDTIPYIYKGDVVTFSDNEYIQITSDVGSDTSWVHVLMLTK